MTQRRKAIQFGQNGVGHYHIRMKLMHQSDQLFSVAGLADHLNAGILLQLAGQKTEKFNAVICNDHGGLAVHVHSLLGILSTIKIETIKGFGKIFCAYSTIA